MKDLPRLRIVHSFRARRRFLATSEPQGKSIGIDGPGRLEAMTVLEYAAKT
jgi:hypothetical protein